MKGKKKDMVHTSVYAEVQNSGGIGAASTRTFSDRMKIKGNRQKIREYNDSRVVTQAYASSGVKAKTYEMPERKDAFLNKDRQLDSALNTKSTVMNTSNTSGSSISKNTGMKSPSRPPATRNPGISRKI